jgi:hypothetical protein
MRPARLFLFKRSLKFPQFNLARAQQALTPQAHYSSNAGRAK